jgi:protein-S-isoprenylcysteine O-methyltransferase Ste14
MLQVVTIIELILCWIAWSMAFAAARQRHDRQKMAVRAPISWLGIMLQMFGFAINWAFLRPEQFLQAANGGKSPISFIAAISCAVSMILGPVSVAIAWAATRRLGKFWRFEAALNDDHELVQTGPYRRLRHPIYASMLGMFLATGTAGTWWPMFAVALVIFLIGTEIRVRAEDNLLAERYQETFVEYRSRVRGYIPFIR